MFKKSQRKIVSLIMSILVSLWIGTLCIIYGSSYYEVSHRNREMLDWHMERYLPEQPLPNGASPDRMVGNGASSGSLAEKHAAFDSLADSGMSPGGLPKLPPERPRFENSPAFQLSTFYSVAISKDGQILETRNSKTEVYSNQELEAIAREILANGRPAGVKDSLIYRMADKGSYTLIAFMDNTLIQESMTTLFQSTLAFGGIAILALFFLSSYLAKRIVQPLEESYEKQKQFISDAGHELKTPVSVVSANAELLSRELGRNQWLANIQYENERMGLLIGQLLDLARTEHVTPQMETIDFSRLAGGEALPFESVAFEKGLSLRYEISPGIQVKGNDAQLRQLASILLDNAIRHSAPGGEALLTLRSRRGHALLSVTNDGDEIPKAQQKQLFERFYRADPARNSEGNHYGLGLSIAKAITSAHNGTIEVECQKGKVTFTVRLPISIS